MAPSEGATTARPMNCPTVATQRAVLDSEDSSELKMSPHSGFDPQLAIMHLPYYFHGGRRHRLSVNARENDERPARLGESRAARSKLEQNAPESDPAA